MVGFCVFMFLFFFIRSAVGADGCRRFASRLTRLQEVINKRVHLVREGEGHSGLGVVSLSVGGSGVTAPPTRCPSPVAQRQGVAFSVLRHRSGRVSHNTQKPFATMSAKDRLEQVKKDCDRIKNEIAQMRQADNGEFTSMCGNPWPKSHLTRVG